MLFYPKVETHLDDSAVDFCFSQALAQYCPRSVRQS